MEHQRLLGPKTQELDPRRLHGGPSGSDPKAWLESGDVQTRSHGGLGRSIPG